MRIVQGVSGVQIGENNTIVCRTG
ncbi:MAG: hypothetical protein LAT57_11655, partial [Balneolales bacterium]|nr:hypothetical protein [Balneolales bacterium]